MGHPALANDRTLIQIRERSFLDLLDLALVVTRSRPRVVILAGLAGVLPFVLLNNALVYAYDVSLPYYFLLLVMETPWATAPLTVVLGGLMFGERPTARKVAVTLFRAFPALLAYQGLLRCLLLGTVVLSPVLPARLGFMNEVVLLEHGKFWGVVKRSSVLCGLRGADLFGQWVAQLIFGGLFVFCFWFGTGAMFRSLTTSELTWDEFDDAVLLDVRFQAAFWVTVVFFGVARFLTYIDQRIRLEGWELKLRLQAVGRSIEESGRW